jgi:hypothetical protein
LNIHLSKNIKFGLSDSDGVFDHSAGNGGAIPGVSRLPPSVAIEEGVEFVWPTFDPLDEASTGKLPGEVAGSGAAAVGRGSRAIV